MTGIRGTYGYLIGDCGLPSGRGLVVVGRLRAKIVHFFDKSVKIGTGVV